MKEGVETQRSNVKMFGKPIINRHANSKIIIESGVTLISDTKDNLAGINHPVILATLSQDAEIIIGKDSGLSGATICAAKSIKIGTYVGIGANVCIYDTDFHPIDPYERRYEDYKTKSSPVIIDDYAWIGGNSIILKGVRVGKGSVVGAGSVVTKDVPDFEIHAGNPARFIKKIEYNHETHPDLFNACT
jgi:bifunctional N-acetylglucosamine-1-phosphate-uridyltransferase/glucosamine-1-phosphate-acetyltransferase GlmU-like protein